MDSGKYDHVFLGILQDCVHVQPFLEAIFSFLARRTDFFLVMQNESEKMGFLPGVAENIVRSLFVKYQGLVLGAHGGSKEKKKKSKKADPKKTVDATQKQSENAGSGSEKDTMNRMENQEPMQEDTASHIPNVVESTVEVTASDDRPEEMEQAPSKDVPPSGKTETDDSESNVAKAVTEKTEQPAETKEERTEQQAETKEEKTEQQAETKEERTDQQAGSVGGEKEQAEAAADSKQESSPGESEGMLPGTDPDCYNGAVLENYTWSQTIRDVDVKVPVPRCIRKARDIGVEIKALSLKVYIKANVPPEELKSGSKTLIDGKLHRQVRCEECMWSLEAGECILINLEKTEERFWTTVIEGDPEINRHKVDSTRDIHDFDEQTQTDYAQVMYDHRQKMMGKPTVKEQQTNEILKKAWNAKGSPFAGTPFDPSKVNVSS